MRFLFILLLIYLAFRILVNFILPLVLRSVVQKAAQNMQGQGPFADAYQRQANARREGEVSIESEPDTKKTRRPGHLDAGEYVDFTEVK